MSHTIQARASRVARLYLARVSPALGHLEQLLRRHPDVVAVEVIDETSSGALGASIPMELVLGLRSGQAVRSVLQALQGYLKQLGGVLSDSELIGKGSPLLRVNIDLPTGHGNRPR